jgi:hypothetical protein
MRPDISSVCIFAQAVRVVLALPAATTAYAETLPVRSLRRMGRDIEIACRPPFTSRDFLSVRLIARNAAIAFGAGEIVSAAAEAVGLGAFTSISPENIACWTTFARGICPIIFVVVVVVVVIVPRAK